MVEKGAKTQKKTREWYQRNRAKINTSVSSLISGDIHGLIQVRKPQARIIKYMRNRVPLISSQTIRIISKVNNQQQENVPEKNDEIQHVIQPKLMSNAKQAKMRER